MAEKILDNRLNIRNNCHIFNILYANVCRMGKKVERGQVLPDKPRSTQMHNINCIVLLKYNSVESIAQVAYYI